MGRKNGFTKGLAKTMKSSSEFFQFLSEMSLKECLIGRNSWRIQQRHSPGFWRISGGSSKNLVKFLKRDVLKKFENIKNIHICIIGIFPHEVWVFTKCFISCSMLNISHDIPLCDNWYLPTNLYINRRFFSSKLTFPMPQKSKRQSHARTVSSSFLPQENPDNKGNNGSSEEDFKLGADDNDQMEPFGFESKVTDENVSDLFERCKSKCPVKYLSVLVYVTLRRFGISWRDCDAFPRNIGELHKENDSLAL